MTGPDAVILLAGGAGRRLGGIDKAAIVVGGRTLLDHALQAAVDALVVVVGPPRDLPDGVLAARESPAGGGPAAAVVAGLGALSLPDDAVTAVLAVDMPGVAAPVLALLRDSLEADDLGTGAVLVDSAGRRQVAAGVYRTGALRAAIARRQTWSRARLTDLLGSLVSVEVAVPPAVCQDIDTPDDLRLWSGN